MALAYEDVDVCPVCGNRDRQLWTRGEDSSPAFRCIGCSLVYLGRRISAESAREYFRGYGQRRDADDPDTARKRQQMYGIDRDFLQTWLQGGKLLDVGAGAADFIAGLPAPFQKYAFDIDAGAVRQAQERHPSVVSTDDIESLARDGPFDGIVFRGSLQYQRDLRATSSFCAEQLKPGGMLFVLATPNVDSPMGELFRERWTLFDPVEHLCYFNASSLQTLFRGFELRKCEYPYLGTPYENWRDDLATFVRLCRSDEGDTRFAFWGSMLNAVFSKSRRRHSS
jgi:SAM-dependent methyltransferase